MAKINLFLASHLWVFIPLILWSLAWKGIALWKSARRGSYIWFIALLALNTLGILEIIYIFFFTRERDRISIEPAGINGQPRRKYL